MSNMQKTTLAKQKAHFIKTAQIAKKDKTSMILAGQVFDSVNKFLTSNHAMNFKGSVESLGEVGELLTTNDSRQVDAGSIEQLIDSCGTGLTADLKASCCIEVSRILAGVNADPLPFINQYRDDISANGPDRVSMSSIYGQGSISMLRNDERLSVESFGEYSDRVAADSRLNIALTIMRAHRSLIDRVLPRSAQEDPIVTIKIPNPQVYDLDISQSSPASVRNNLMLQTPMIELYRNPAPVDTTPKPVVFIQANDTATPSSMLGDNALVAGQLINLYDLAFNPNQIGTQHIDFTDLISDGGAVDTIIIQITHAAAGANPAVTELFPLKVRWHREAQYTTVNNSNDSGDRSVQLQTAANVTVGSKLVNGSVSAILANYTGVDVNLKINFNSVMNIKTGNIQGNGSVNATLVGVGGVAVPGAITTDWSAVTVSIAGYIPALYYSEENLRKTTAAVRIQYKQQQFMIPVGRSFVTDYSLSGQELGEDVLRTTSEMINLGNSYRSLNLITETLNVVNDRLAYEATAPNSNWYTSVAQDYAAGTTSLPYVYTGSIDVADAAVMRETERLGDLHSYLTSRLTAIIADAHNKSLYCNNFENGERPVYKVITSTTIKDVLFGIVNYYNILNDVEAIAEGSDYSLKLPNGTRLDVVATTFEQLEGQMIIIPVRESNPEDITSFGKILDRGSYTAQYTPVNYGAANKRIVTNSREIMFPTNPLGFLVTVAGLDTELQLMLVGDSANTSVSIPESNV